MHFYSTGLVYGNLINLIRKVDDKLSFDWSDRYGWLTINPFNIGASIQCKVRIHYVGENAELKKFCKLNDIQLVIGEENGKKIAEVTNGKVFGLSEFDCLKLFYDNLVGLVEFLRNPGNCEQNEHRSDKVENDENEHTEKNEKNEKNPNHPIEEANDKNVLTSEVMNENLENIDLPEGEIGANGENTENEDNESKCDANLTGDACNEHTESNIIDVDENVDGKPGVILSIETEAPNEDILNDAPSNENAVDENEPNREVSNEIPPNEETSNEEASNQGASNGETSEVKAQDEEAVKKEIPNEEMLNTEAPNEEVSN